MERIEFELNGHTITFDCDARDTRNGFAHDARFCIDYRFWWSSTANYLNRTWEHWRFQSVCLSCVSHEIESRIELLKLQYKIDHSISRLSGKAHKEAFQKIVDSDKWVVLLRDIKKVLIDRCF